LLATALFAAALLTSPFAGCAQPTPEERVAAMRGLYTATLQNFVVRDTPQPVAEVTLVEPAEAAGEEGAEPGEAILEPVPVATKIVLDVLIRNENRENLPGLTLEVAQMAEGGPEQGTWDEIVASPQHKASWRIWVDTSSIGRGPGTSVTHLLENVEGYAPGDRFVVTVRHPVPPGERGDYREFAEAS
jgi:hypothetical protein